MTGDTVNFLNFEPRSHHEEENVVSYSLKANKAMGLTLFSPLVSFVSSIIFSMKFKALYLRKANSGFFYEVNIGKEAIFDVCNTSMSLSVSGERIKGV